MPEKVFKTKQRKRRDSSTIDYFSEEKFRNEILPFVNDEDYKIPDSFVKDIFAICDGMINTEFRNNAFVIENRNELKNECFYEVLKSLKKFKSEKKAFPYFNRIIKNTLLKIYYKNLKYSSKEIGYFDITKNIDQELSQEEAISMIFDENIDINERIIIDNSKRSSNTNYFSEYFDTNHTKENIKEKRQQNQEDIEFSIYQYLDSITEKIDYTLNNETNMMEYLAKLKYNDDFISKYGNLDLVEILSTYKKYFNECKERIKNKYQDYAQKLEFKKTNSSVFVNNKVLVYAKNKISDRKLRNRYKNLFKDVSMDSLILKILLE